MLLNPLRITHPPHPPVNEHNGFHKHSVRFKDMNAKICTFYSKPACPSENSNLKSKALIWKFKMADDQNNIV